MISPPEARGRTLVLPLAFSPRRFRDHYEITSPPDLGDVPVGERRLIRVSILQSSRPFFSTAPFNCRRFSCPRYVFGNPNTRCCRVRRPPPTSTTLHRPRVTPIIIVHEAGPTTVPGRGGGRREPRRHATEPARVNLAGHPYGAPGFGNRQRRIQTIGVI